MIWGERFLDCMVMASQPIDAKLLSVVEDVAPSVTITLRVLGDQLLDAGLGHGKGPLLIALLDRDLLAERILKYAFEVG